MIFQDPISSLNPRRKVRDSVMEPLAIWGRGTDTERDTLVDAVLENVGIDPERAAESRPHQFSGGQCQRISIARSLVLDPTLIICDEPVSALDVSVQAQVLNLLEDLKAEYGLTLIFIAHDLAVVKNISDRVAVMYLGKLCEVASSDDLYGRPAHPYTNVLLDSIPIPDPEVDVTGTSITGEPPSPVNPPTGCRFHPRCPHADEICVSTEPIMRPIADGHFIACHHPLETPVTID
jgi:peptide/nickel transport system ATP-binding protein